jgi:hypothetical protein
MLSSTAADSRVEALIVVDSMEVDFTAVATEVGTADTASNLSVISYKFYVVSSLRTKEPMRLGWALVRRSSLD